MSDSPAADWSRLERLFHDALDLEPDARQDFVTEQTADSPELRTRVLALLESQVGLDDDFLQPPAPQETTPSDLSGREFAGYRLIRRIGVGGMGAVYEARQERPRRTVALKLLRTSLYSASAVKRFEFEAEVLARLDHAGIAKVHAAGTHDDGTGPVPYFAMELVADALDLAAYCDRHELDARERIELFLHVAEAVEHGHQRGVLHRDLKPGNVLVGSGGEPKVIDFGVARALDPEMGGTLRTAAGEIIGTLGYMSPEQTLGDPNSVDVRSDVFALGGLLYRLLTGRPPHDVDSRPITEALRVVQAAVVRAPSAFRRELRGDLETVVLAALAPERSDRYPTVNAFAEDLRRYLHSEPVLRSPPGAWRRATLFLRRHRRAAFAGAVVAAALIGATLVSTRFGLAAHESARLEGISARRSRRVSAFLERLLEAAKPMATLGKVVSVRDVLDEARALIEVELADDPEVEAEIRAILGSSYHALGDLEEAEKHYRRMQELWASSGVPDSALVARRRVEFGRLLIENAARDEGHELVSAGHAALVAFLGADAPETLLAEEVLAESYRSRGEFEVALELSRSVFARLEETLGPRHSDTLGMGIGLARTLIRGARYEEARELLAGLVQAWTEARGAEHPWTITARRALAEALTALGRIDEAADHLEPLARAIEEIWGPRHPNTLSTRVQLAFARGLQGRLEESRGMFAELVAVGDELPPLRDTIHANAYTGLGRVQVLGGDLIGARHSFELAKEARERRHGPDDYRTWKQVADLASVLADREEAERLLRATYAALRETQEADHESVVAVSCLLGRLLLEEGRPAEAEVLVRDALSRRERTLGPRHSETLHTACLCALAIAEQGRLGEAEQLARTELAYAAEVWPGEHWRRAEPEATLGRVLALRTDAAAADRLRHARGLLVATFGEANPDALRTAAWLAQCESGGSAPGASRR